jgi:hypothetical protein
MLDGALLELASFVLPPGMKHHLKAWSVFLGCLLCSALGVGICFWVFGGKMTGIRLWGISLVISIVMLGVSYGAKYANLDARESFTPMDLIQYLSQGFLWPSTWPALANFLGVEKIEPPIKAALSFVGHLFSLS